MTAPRIPRQVAITPFLPELWQADDGTTLMQLDPRESVVAGAPLPAYRVVYRGPVFHRMVGNEIVALSYYDIHRMNNEGVVTFKKLVRG